ncbi:hypothetical protein AAGG74_16155 [Bacillus mexicanus]|uniref:hypothetical protein n=1 Tax=Bacillus mexicanus TaxID=2834415 RepID=UPI003D1C779F
MSYSLVIPKTPFNKPTVEVTGSYLNKNNLWNVNNGEMLLLHCEEDNKLFLKTIGVLEGFEQANYFSYPINDMTEIFKKYYKSGELYRVVFDCDAIDDYEEECFVRKIKYGIERSDEEAAETADHFLSLISFYDPISVRYFSIIKDNIQISIYMNSVILVSGCNNAEEHKIALEVYEEIFDSLGKDFKTTSINIKEKEKVDHPLKNSNRLLSTLFESANDELIKRLGINSTEYEKIKTNLLDYTKDFETRKIYKN